jgi:CheY-like chemotaxis protein
MDSVAEKALLGARVLVVDDDDDSRELFSRVLAGAGAHVRVAPNAKGARKVVAAWRPNVVVSDIMMPDEDGFTLVRDLQSAAGLDHTAIIAVTGLASTRTRSTALAAGFRDCVFKPLPPDELVALVARWARAS